MKRRKVVARLFLVMLCLAATPALFGQSNSTQLGVFSKIPLKGIKGLCDSTVNEKWSGKAWIQKTTSVYGFNSAGYINASRVYDSAGNLTNDAVIVYNSNNKAVSSYTNVNITGFGYVKYSTVTADTNAKGQTIYEHANVLALPSTTTYYEFERYIYTYNSAGLMIGNHKISYNNNTKKWEDKTADSFNYDSKGQLLYDSSFFPDMTSGIETLNGRKSYTYDASGKVTQVLIEGYDAAKKKFIGNARITLKYNASNQRTTLSQEIYDQTNNTWAENGRDTSTYDASGYETRISYAYDPKVSKWNLSKRQYCAASSVAPPAAPGNLVVQKIKKVNDKKLMLTWTDNSSDENGFIIWRSPDGTNGWMAIDSVGMDVATFTDTGLAPATAYYYKVTAWNSAGVSPASNTANTTTYTSILEISADDVFTIYPNPSRGELSVVFNTSFSGAIQLQVTDALGKIVLNTPLAANSISARLDLAAFPAGIYILSVKDNNTCAFKKIMIGK